MLNYFLKIKRKLDLNKYNIECCCLNVEEFNELKYQFKIMVVNSEDIQYFYRNIQFKIVKEGCYFIAEKDGKRYKIDILSGFESQIRKTKKEIIQMSLYDYLELKFKDIDLSSYAACHNVLQEVLTNLELNQNSEFPIKLTMNYLYCRGLDKNNIPFYLECLIKFQKIYVL